MKPLAIVICIVSVVVVGAGLSSTTTAATTHAGHNAKVVIQHQTHGCHAWSINGGRFSVSKWTSVPTGGSATFVDNDVMPHKLILTSGPAVRFVGNPAMNHIGDSVKVVFTKAGTYRFTTKFGEDYKGVAPKTIGKDNVLHLVVTVS